MADIRLQDIIIRFGKGEGRIIRRHRGKPAGRSAGVSQESLGHAVDFACAAAAINVSRKGCSPPTQKEVEDFIVSTHR